MQYQGGKRDASSGIAHVLMSVGSSRLLEPFVGGASVTAKAAPHFETVVAADSSLDLILCWRAIQTGWVPPTDVDKQLYDELRCAEPSALRGFVGYGCSFGGAWFNGYSPPTPPRPRVPGGENPAAQAHRSCLRKMRGMGDVHFATADYRTWRPGNGWVVYADPPYAGVRKHRDLFNSDEFWQVMRDWAERGAQVFVSEYTAPIGWECVWSRETPRKMEGNRGMKQTERLFTRA